MNVNGLSVDETPMNVNDLDVDRNQTNWTSSHSDFPHYQIPLLGCLGPFSDAHPLLPTPNLSPVCVTAQAPRLSCQIACALKHLLLSNGFGMTPLQGWTAFPFVHDPYLHASYASVLARWIPGRSHQTTFSVTP